MSAERHVVCKSDAVPEGKGRSFVVDGRNVAVFNVSGEFFALEDRCSHINVPIFDGYVHQREFCVACPWHGSEFELSTGKAMTPPACEDITAYVVFLEGSDVVIEVPEGK